MKNSNTALRSFFGTSGGREQTVLTPADLVEVVRLDLGGTIALDPCAAVGSCVGAEREVLLPEDGLSVPWDGPTYVNPPYNDLRPWFRKAREAPAPVIMLVPVRTNRVWWMEALHDSSACTALKPIAFLGFAQTFPSPLCLMYFRCAPNAVLAYDRFSGSLK